MPSSFVPSAARGDRSGCCRTTLTCFAAHVSRQTRSPHPSFCILHLHPPPKKLAVRRGDAVTYRGQYLPPPTLHSSARSSVAPSSRAGGSRRGTHAGSDMGSGTGSGSFSFTNSTFSGSIGIPPRSRLNQEHAIAEENEEHEGGSGSRRRGADGLQTAVPGASVGSGSVDDGMLVGERMPNRMRDDDESDEEVVSCASLITQTDWSETPLGPVRLAQGQARQSAGRNTLADDASWTPCNLQRAKWPGSLRTALSILLKTPNECVICASRLINLARSSASPS